MWLLIDNSENIKELNNGDTITFGRSSTNIVLSNDASISRNHAKLEVSTTNDTEKVIIKDLGSKYGTFLLNDNKDCESLKITNDGYEIKNNDKIRFGLRNHIFSFIFKPKIKYQVLISRVHENDKNNLQKIFDKIGGKMLNSWCDSCTHLTTTKTGITEKVACALASGIPIVNINYWGDVFKAQKTKSTIPDPIKYMPALDNSFLDDKKASLSPNLLRKKTFDGLVFYHFEKNQCDLYSTMIRLAGGRSLEYNQSFKIKDCVKDNIIIVLPPDEIETQSSSFENFQKISMELAQNKLRAIPSTEIALAIFYCSTDKFCNPRFKYKKLFRSAKMPSAEDQNKSPIIAEDSQGIDTSPILKSQRIIPESAPLESSVIENPVGKSLKNKLKNSVVTKKINPNKIEESFLRTIKNKELGNKKSDNQVNHEIHDKNQTQESFKEKSIDADKGKTIELAPVQKSAVKNKVKDSCIQYNKNSKINDDDNQIQEPTINKNSTVDDKSDEETDECAANLRKNLIETSFKKKRKDIVDDTAVHDDTRNSGSEQKKIKLVDEHEDKKNKSAWDILSHVSQDESKSRNTSKKIVNDKENILNPEDRFPDSDDDSAQNISKTSLEAFDNISIKQEEPCDNWTNGQKKRKEKNDLTMKSGLVEYIFIGRRVTPRKPKIGGCRRNQYRIPKKRLKCKDMYIWEPEK